MLYLLPVSVCVYDINPPCSQFTLMPVWRPRSACRIPASEAYLSRSLSLSPPSPPLSLSLSLSLSHSPPSLSLPLPLSLSFSPLSPSLSISSQPASTHCSCSPPLPDQHRYLSGLETTKQGSPRHVSQKKNVGRVHAPLGMQPRRSIQFFPAEEASPPPRGGEIGAFMAMK